MPNPVKAKVVVTEVVPHGSGTYCIKMTTDSFLPRAKLGQFLHLTIDEYDPTGGFWPESRVFSIASAPGAPELEIVYSVKGRYTKKMEDFLRPGVELWIKLPYGEFIVDSIIGEGNDIFLIAGGTGISPFLPYLDKLLSEPKFAVNISLFYGVRKNEMVLGLDLLKKCHASGRVDVHIFVEDEEPDQSLKNHGKTERGRLNSMAVYGLITRKQNTDFFLSGPPGMIRAFKDSFIDQGINPDNIKIDDWE